jgi:hypothetical protein
MYLHREKPDDAMAIMEDIEKLLLRLQQTKGTQVTEDFLRLLVRRAIHGRIVIGRRALPITSARTGK